MTAFFYVDSRQHFSSHPFLGRMTQKDTGRERKETLEDGKRQTDKCEKTHMILKRENKQN